MKRFVSFVILAVILAGALTGGAVAWRRSAPPAAASASGGRDRITAPDPLRQCMFVLAGGTRPPTAPC